MPAEHYDQAKSIFLSAAELPAAERAAFLDKECKGQPQLRAQVEALLAADPGSDSTMLDPKRPPTQSQPREREIGPYRILEQLGEGGFGVVYLAEQTSPVRRRVALKVIKPGMDSARILARFEAERQALAMMDHPSIAKVFDAGTTEPGDRGGERPYFVMEHAPGEPITTYCDRHRLGTRARLELFMQVCQAVQHAHTKGVIHRDLKPGNVLVVVRQGQDPVPKVIDFGIAKSLHGPLGERTVFTEQGQVMGTPEYMSPEQVEMGPLDIDTRSDVYSLGVMLYELLAGGRPFDLSGVSLVQMAKILREQEPARPSTKLIQSGDAAAKIAELRRMRPEALTRELRRELEWIPLKALKKDRTERYQTAADLAKDLENYLEGRPLIAGPDSAAYQVRKFVRRHRAMVGAAGAVAAALVLGLAGTLWQARRAEERSRAAAKAEGEARTAAEAEAAARLEAEVKRKLADAKTAEAERALKDAQFEAYLANITAADAALNANDIAAVRRRLDACPEELRGWEWRYLNAESDTCVAVLGTDATILAAEISPDGSEVVTVSSKVTTLWNSPQWTKKVDSQSAAFERLRDATLDPIVFSTAGAVPLGIIRYTLDPIGFSTAGTLVLSQTDNGGPCIAQLSTGRRIPLETPADTGIVTFVTFSRSGKFVAVVNDRSGYLRVFDTDTGQRVSTVQSRPFQIRFFAFSPDGSRIVSVTGQDASATVSDVGAATHTDLPHRRNVRSAEFSDDGQRIVTVSADDTVQVWSADDGKPFAPIRRGGYANAVAALNPNGRRVAVAPFGASRVNLHDAETGAQQVVLIGHEGRINSIVFQSQGGRILTASDDGTVRVWDAITGAELAVRRGHTGPVHSAHWSPDGKRIVSISSDGSARVWDADERARWQQSATFTGGFLSPQEDLYAVLGSNANAVVFKVTGELVVTLRGHSGLILGASWSPDGTRVATASADTTARLWDARAGTELACLRGHGDKVWSVAFSPDGRSLVTGSADKSVRVWDASSGDALAVWEEHAESVGSVAWSPSGRLIASGSDDATIRVWQLGVVNPIVVLPLHALGSVYPSWSPDGSRLSGTSMYNKVVRLWETSKWREVLVIKLHGNGVPAVDFSPNGSCLFVSRNQRSRPDLPLDPNERWTWDTVPWRERVKSLKQTEAEKKTTDDAAGPGEPGPAAPGG